MGGSPSKFWHYLPPESCSLTISLEHFHRSCSKQNSSEPPRSPRPRLGRWCDHIPHLCQWHQLPGLSKNLPQQIIRNYSSLGHRKLSNFCPLKIQDCLLQIPKKTLHRHVYIIPHRTNRRSVGNRLSRWHFWWYTKFQDSLNKAVASITKLLFALKPAVRNRLKFSHSTYYQIFISAILPKMFYAAPIWLSEGLVPSQKS